MLTWFTAVDYIYACDTTTLSFGDFVVIYKSQERKLRVQKIEHFQVNLQKERKKNNNNRRKVFVYTNESFGVNSMRFSILKIEQKKVDLNERNNSGGGSSNLETQA